MTYYKSNTGVAVGGWHAEAGNGMTREQCEELIVKLEPFATSLGAYLIPSYIGAATASASAAMTVRMVLKR